MKKNRLWTALLSAIAALALSGCVAAAWEGVSGDALVRSANPRYSLAANAPLTLQGYGRAWVALPTDYMGIAPTGAMDYAVYGEGAEGMITRHAHVFSVRPSNDREWRFQPESYPAPGGLSIGRQVVGERQWTTQIIRVSGESDWFNAMWRESGRETPELWIARRFSATPAQAQRVVAEYREPWPECLDPEAKDLKFVPASCLDGFVKRSDEAFTLEIYPEIGERELPAAPSVLQRPPFYPDMKRLAGELIEEDLHIRPWRRQ